MAELGAKILSRIRCNGRALGMGAAGLFTAVVLVAAVVPVFLVLLAACAQPATESADAARNPVEARASVDRAVATTGDQITYRVEIDSERGYTVEVPEPGAAIAGFRILDLGRDGPREDRGRIAESRWYRLRADFVGSYVLPPVAVTYRSPDGQEGSLATSEIFVEVQSVLPTDGTATDIRDVKPLREPARRVPWIVGVALAVLVAAVAAIWWWRRRRRTLAAVPMPAPHEIAFRELDRLRRTDFSNLAELRAYYFQISEVLRAYVEGRYGVNATDLATEEILGRRDWLERLDPADVERLQRFLLATDRVKFAARVPELREIEDTYEGALSFIESTRPRPAAEGAIEGTASGPPALGASDPTWSSPPALDGVAGAVDA